MKKILVIFLALACCSAQAQRWGKEFGLTYNYSNPFGGMGRIIDQGHGIAMHYGWVAPTQRFSIGLDGSFGQYGRDKSRQQYTFDDGTEAPMDIIVSNLFANISAYTRWYLETEKPLRPFLFGKLGYTAFSTELNIFDPDDNDHCEPVDKDVLCEDGTIALSLGAGVKLDMASIFKKMQTNRFFIESTVTITQGGTVRYMNTDADVHHQHHHSSGDEVMAEFINTQTQIVHKHHVGYLYNNPLQMFELRFGFSMHIQRSDPPIPMLR